MLCIMSYRQRTMDPASIERKIYQSFWNDGITDLAVGLGVTLVGFAWQVDVVALTLVIPVALLPLWILGRRRISEPRAGFVRFSTERGEKVHRTSVTASIVGYGVLMAVGASYLVFRNSGAPARWLEPVVAAIPMLVLATVFLLGRWVFDLPRRSAVYGVFALGVAAAGIALALPPGLQFVAVGLLIMLGGTGILWRFLRKNPTVALPEGDREGR